MKIIRTDAFGNPIQQGTDAWHALRTGMVTASMVYDIITRQFRDPKKYTDAREKAIRSMVWELLSGTPDKSYGNKYMKDGIEREPFARMYMEETFGYVIEEVAFVKHDWMRVGVSPDGMVVGQKRNVEIKCPKDTTHVEYLMLDKAPDIYVPQIQTQMWITESDVTDFCSYHPGAPAGLDVHIIEVPRDDAYIAMIQEEVSKFLAECNVRVKELKERGIHNQLLREKRAGNFSTPLVEQTELTAH